MERRMLDTRTEARMRADVTTSLEARLQRLEDLEEIRSLILDHGRFLDTGKVDDFIELFAENGAEWEGSFGVFKGRAAIKEAVARYAANPDLMSPSNCHFLSSIEIDVNGDRAVGWSRWAVVTQSSEGHAKLLSIGVYDDTFVREKGRWKFDRRVVTALMPAA